MLYRGAICIATNTFSKAMVPSSNYRYDSFSTKDAVDNIAGPALDKMAICSERKEIVLVYHT
jgi:hypothetical protein